MPRTSEAVGQSAGELYRAGRLAQAVEAATAAVRKAPTDLAARMMLAEMLLFAGNLERADVILDAAAQVEPATAVVVSEFRQLLRAEVARRQLRRDGRVPEFLGEPTQAQKAILVALIAQREGNHAEAARAVAAAEEIRPHVRGRAGDLAFDDFRDADDICAGFFEVLTTTGKYFWVPIERVAGIEFHPPKRPRDLFWRRASMSVTDGPDGDVYIPCIYGSDDADLPDELRLGRATDWRQDDTGPVRGVGQRMFLVGEDAIGIMELTTLSFGA
ncbi:type VI secretion system accessory protein TagJ [Limobrevibacterium gyesilva]|uniref:Tetratricopeptide repeat protein n=1 Tax=Limobrevibacterium gyesilva TaxID=2991712 RepID=A0AA41YJT2_9PROT|nr:type VI secretion system accessory protein TagJ [Limobrevibacterium gyesilva]MCW3473895.1 tetratricopeptide repeat protein [Limobrevibacterium gyesilva]